MKSIFCGLLLCCVSLTFFIGLSSCDARLDNVPASETASPEHGEQPATETTPPEHGEQPPPETAPPEHTEQPAPETTPPEHTGQPDPETAPPEHTGQPDPETASPEHTEQPAPESPERILSVCEAQNLVNDDLRLSSSVITYMQELDKTEGGVLFYGFSVDSSADLHKKSIAYSISYAWVNSVTGVVWYEESYPYANIPDSRFPIPMRDGTVIPYDRYSPPDWVRNAGYSFRDVSVMETYKAQLREAGFVDHGEVMSVDDLWTYEWDEDGSRLMVEIYDGGYVIQICLYISY